jgi:DNA-binding transcriptional ArsR family regulator
MKLLGALYFVKRAKNRLIILKALDKPQMPSELVIKIYGKSSNTHFNIVSRALAELKEAKIVEILNPKEKTGRMYKRTNLGIELQKLLKQ